MDGHQLDGVSLKKYPEIPRPLLVSKLRNQPALIENIPPANITRDRIATTGNMTAKHSPRGIDGLETTVGASAVATSLTHNI